MSDGMFLSACRHVAKDFPDIAYDEDLLDRACLQVSPFHFSIQSSKFLEQRLFRIPNHMRIV